MALIQRLTTWAANQLLKSADLNGEFNNVVNLFNNLDSATTAWTNVKGGTINGTTAVQLNGNAIGSVTTFTPTVAGCGTIANASGFYQSLGNVVHVWGSYQCGTVAASTFSITVPTGSITYTNRAETTGVRWCGGFFLMEGSTTAYTGHAGVLFLDGSDTAKVYGTLSTPASGTAAWPKQNGSAIFSTNDYVPFDFFYAIA